VLPDQGCRTFRGTVIDEYGGMVRCILRRHLALDILTKWPIDWFPQLVVCDLFYDPVSIQSSDSQTVGRERRLGVPPIL
jgi:hypothetical protein